MKKKNLSPEELRRIEYEFSEYKDALPEEYVNTLERVFEIIRPHITIELPMYQELLPVIGKLMNKQYPSLSLYAGCWAARWMGEISEDTAQKLAVDLSLLFDDFQNGVSRTGLYDDFESIVRFYVSPREAHRREMPNFEGAPFWEQEKEGILKEWEDDYEEDKISCERYNRMKSEFIQAVQPIIFNYFGQQTDTLTTEMWQHYGIILGSAYHEYSDNCSDLEYIFEVDELTTNPEIGFYEYNRQLSARILESTEKLTLANEPKNS